MQPDSWNSVLSSMSVNDKKYYETTIDDFPQLMRSMNVPVGRRPPFMKDWRFTTNLFTAVGCSAGDVRYLVCLERIE